jgi:hypothetical protein
MRREIFFAAIWTMVTVSLCFTGYNIGRINERQDGRRDWIERCASDWRVDKKLGADECAERYDAIERALTR